MFFINIGFECIKKNYYFCVKFIGIEIVWLGCFVYEWVVCVVGIIWFIFYECNLFCLIW